MSTLVHGSTTLTTDASWEGSATQNVQTAKYHFATGGKYVDEDIDLQITAKDGSASTSASVTTTPVVTITEGGTFTSTGKTSYGVTTTKPDGTDGTNYLTIDGSGSVTTTGVATSYRTIGEGWLAAATNTAGGTVNITPTITDNFEPYYIPVVGVSFGGGAPSLTAKSNAITTSMTTHTTAATGDYSIAATASAKGYRAKFTYTNSAGAIAAHSGTTASDAATESSAETISATTLYVNKQSVTENAGSVSDTTYTQGTVTISEGYNASAITKSGATFASTATSGTTYTDISATTAAPVLVAGDYLYINKGWTDNVKISLARLVPDGSDVKGHANYILSGHSAYDNDGTLVSGSIATWSPSSTYYTDTNTGYGQVTGGQYIASTKYIIKGVGAANTASATITGWSGSESTATSMAYSDSKPSSGDYYTLTANGSGSSKISTAGWMPTGALTAASTTKAYYVAKATSSTSGDAASASTSVTGMVTSTSDTGYSVTASASAPAQTATVSAGYNPSAVTKSSTAKSASSTTYIQKGVLSASVSSNTGGSASMAATNLNTTSSGSYYVTLSTSAGSVKAKASVGTEGYVKSETNETAATSVSVSGNGNKLYVSSTNITGSTTVNEYDASGASSTTYSTAGILTSAPSAPYLDLVGNGSATAKSVYTGTATAAHKYVAIYDGTFTATSA